MRLLALFLLVVALPAHAQGRTLIIIGSSSACGPFGQYIARELRGTYGRPLHVCHSASGMARPDYFDWDEREHDIDFRHQHVVVLMGGNDAQNIRYQNREGEWRWIRFRDQDAWEQEYTTRFHRFLEYMCTHGSARVFVVLPPPVMNERLEGRLEQVRDAQIEAIQRTSCADGSMTGAAVFDDEAYYLPDHVHLSRAGAALAWEHLGPHVIQSLGELDGEEEPVP